MHVARLGRFPDFARSGAGPDELFEAGYAHVGADCSSCDRSRLVRRKDRSKPERIAIHHGTMASGNAAMRDSAMRDKLSSELHGVLCFDIEATGMMNRFPCVVSVPNVTDLALLRRYCRKRLLT